MSKDIVPIKVTQTDLQAMEEIRANPFYLAVAIMESSCQPNAVNKTSSAKGIFQLIKATRVALGVTKWDSPAQQLAAFKQLVARNSKVFVTNDPEKLYAAHYLGEPTYRKLLLNHPMTLRQKEIVNNYLKVVAPKFKKVLKQVFIEFERRKKEERRKK